MAARGAWRIGWERSHQKNPSTYEMFLTEERSVLLSILHFLNYSKQSEESECIPFVENGH